MQENMKKIKKQTEGQEWVEKGKTEGEKHVLLWRIKVVEPLALYGHSRYCIEA